MYWPFTVSVAPWILGVAPEHHRSPSPPQRRESPQTHDSCCAHSESPLCLVGPEAVPHVTPLKPPFPPGPAAAQWGADRIPTWAARPPLSPGASLESLLLQGTQASLESHRPHDQGPHRA